MKQIYKIHSDFYYLKDENNFLCAKLKDTLKKQKMTAVVGDFVVEKDGFISEILKRKNFINHPKIANIDYLIIVVAMKEPELDFVQLNRYLTFAKVNNLDVILCFNKEDLEENDILKQKILKIYKPLKYKIIFTSAINGCGIDELKKLIKNKLTALMGLSGVGKTTIVNDILNLNLKTNQVSKGTKRGQHTTRHVEILENNNFKIVDTPGFSNLKFDFISPDKIIDFFDEMKKYKKECRFKNCLHTKDEIGCNIVKNIDKIDETRYNSYLAFLSEANSYKEKISKISIKDEKNHKVVHDKVMTKINKKKRESARNVLKQRIQDE